MPPVQLSHESNKTIITNLDAISKSLYREPSHILKFLSMTIGCNQNIDHGKYGLGGNYDSARLQQMIYDFIDLFVLCRVCRNPETKFVLESGILKRRCASCGSIEVQQQHKLNTLITKDIDRSDFTDTNYDKSSIGEILRLIKEETNNSQEIYNLYKQHSIKLSELFSEYIKPANLKQLSNIIKDEKINDVLDSVENMLESTKKEDKLPVFLKALHKMGFQIEDFEKYFATPKKGKKRSPLIKKNAEYFFDNFE